MAERKFNLTPEQEQELEEYIEECNHTPTRIRYEAILLYGAGVPVGEIMERLGCSRASLMNWCQAYCLMGIKVLKDQRTGGNNTRLTPKQLDDLSYRLNTVTPHNVFGSRASTENGDQWTVEDLYKAVLKWYGVIYRSRTSYYTLLYSSKSKYRNFNKHDEEQGET